MKVASLSGRTLPRLKQRHEAGVCDGGYPGLCGLWTEWTEFGWGQVDKDEVDPKVFAKYDLLWWEWSWAPCVARAVCKIRDANPKLKIIGFVGCADRWWEKTHARDYRVHTDAALASTAIGTFARDEVPFYTAMFPGCKPFHCPTPINGEWVAGYKAEAQRRNKLLLGFHLNVSDDNRDLLAHAAIMRKFQAAQNGVTAMGFCRHDEPEDVQAILSELDMPDLSLRRVVDMASFLTLVRDSYASVHVCRRMIQSQWSMVAAALGVPHVSGTPGDTHTHLWPSLSFDWYDIDGMVGALRKLWDDAEWRQKQIDHAREVVKYYDTDRARERVAKAAGL